MAKSIQGSIGSVITVGAFILIGLIVIKVLKPLGVIGDVKSLFTDSFAQGSQEADNKARLEDVTRQTATETQDVTKAEGTKTRDKVEEAKQDVTKTVTTEGKTIRTQAQQLARQQKIRDAKIHAKTRLLLKHDKERRTKTIAPKGASRTITTNRFIPAIAQNPMFKRQNTAPHTEGFDRQSGAGQSGRPSALSGGARRIQQTSRRSRRG